MPSAPSPPNEPERQAELARYAILSTPPEDVFDRITTLASRLFRCPIVLLSFVDGPRQWFKSCIGVDFRETPRADSFCAWAILSDTALVIPDARTDPRFSDNPLVTGPLGIRFYAGAPLVSPGGFNLGTLCVIDTEPRPQGLTSDELDSLTSFAALAMNALDVRLIAQEAEETKNLLETTLVSIGDGVIVTDSQSRITFLNHAAEQLTGWQRDQALQKNIEEVFAIVTENSQVKPGNPIMTALLERRVVSVEDHTILLTKDGRELAVENSAAPIFRGPSIAGGVLIFRDVTKRRTSERLLEHSENQFRTTFAKAPLGLVLTQTDGRFIEANEAYRLISGYTDEELSSTNFISLTHPAEVENNAELFQRLIREEIQSYVLEKRIITKAGAIRWIRAHATLFRDVGGKASKVIGLVEDITSRKAAEERFRFLAESIPQMVWTATADGMLDYINGPGSQYFGVSPDTLIASAWLNLVHPEDRAKTIEAWSEALKSGSQYETEFRLKRASDAAWRLHLVRALPLIGDDGLISQWFGTCTDVENQFQAAHQIAEDRQRWRDLLLQTPAAIAVLRGPHHTFEWVNSGYQRLVSRTEKALVGKTLREALPEIDTQVYAQLLDNVYQTGEPFSGHEALVQLDSGSGVLQDVYVNFVYLPTRNTAGDIDGIFAHVTDVTGMVAARKTIEESELQFRTLAETIPHLTWMADGTGSIFWYNQRWFDYTGTNLEQMNGWGWDKVHDPEVLPEVMTKWQHALTAGNRFEMIFPLKGADGEFRPFLTRVEPIRDSKGNVVRWFGTNTDITEQLKTEAELRRINRDLEEFSYVASHDLQEPLRMVNVYTQLLLREADTSSERLSTFSAFIAQGVKRMDTLIQDLLAFSRNVHREESQFGTANLSAAFHEARGVLTIPIEDSGAVISSVDLPQTRGETSQIAHVFQNLLSNALKYRKIGVAPVIHIAAKREKNKWIISMQDNGIGFDGKYAEQIFGLFKRLHSKEYAGTGLGLAICKRIVERYGGSMWAESVEGEGAVFYFSLPAAQA